MKISTVATTALIVLVAAPILAGCGNLGSSDASLSAGTPSGILANRRQLVAPAARGRAVRRSYTFSCPCVYVANAYASSTGSITIYPLSATGNYNPGTNVIVGSGTLLNEPFSVALDSAGNIYAANELSSSITVYAAGSSGNVSPTWQIVGSKTGLATPSGVAVDTSGNIYATNGVNDNGTPPYSVTVYPAGSNGNVTPSRTITGSKTGLSQPYSIAVDSSGNIYVANAGTCGGCETVTVYSSTQNGNVSPIRTISGSNTGFGNGSIDVAWFGGRIYITSDYNRVGIFPDTANGNNVAPTKSISGTATKLDQPYGIAIAPTGRIYVGNFGGPNSVAGYSKYSLLAAGNNNIAPVKRIRGAATGLDGPFGLAVH